MDHGPDESRGFDGALKQARELVVRAAVQPRERALASVLAADIDRALALLQASARRGHGEDDDGDGDSDGEEDAAASGEAATASGCCAADVSGLHLASRETVPSDVTTVWAAASADAIVPPAVDRASSVPPPAPHAPGNMALSRDEVVAHIAHDIRTPLAAISLHAGSLARRAVPTTDTGDEMRRSADSIRRSTARITRLVDELLDYSRVASGHISLTLSHAAPGDLIADAVDMLAPLAAERGQRMIWQVRTDTPDVLCDPDRVHQVLVNLMSNAIKFTPPGGLITLATQRCEEGRGVEFAVIDTGPGLCAEDQARVFEPYYQAGAAPRSGFGLGLAIVRAIVEAHGGRAGVTSGRDGAGARFYFVLPAAPAR